MSLGHGIVISAVPFFDLLDREVEAMAEVVFGPTRGEPGVAELVDAEAPAAMPDALVLRSAMETSRRHLAQGLDAFIRRLPAAVRNDTTVTRAAAYALVGLADERMLHYPAGGFVNWREQLLESELYGSALAGQEIIRQARNSTQSRGNDGSELLAPLYLALLREGFEGSLRSDTLGLSSLVSTLEDTVGALRGALVDVASDVGPRRIGLSIRALAVFAFAFWLISGIVFWMALAGDTLEDADRVAERIESGLAATFLPDAAHTISPTSPSLGTSSDAGTE